MQEAPESHDPRRIGDAVESVIDNYTADSIKLFLTISLPAQECPRFHTCSVNDCPLYPGFPELYIDPDDRDRKCTMEKQVRDRIGSKYPGILKYQGLTRNEWAGRHRYDAMSIEDKQHMLENGLRGLIKAKSSALQRQRMSGIHEPIPTREYEILTHVSARHALYMGCKRQIKAKIRLFQRQRSELRIMCVDQTLDYIPATTIEPRFSRTLIRSIEEYELEARP